MCIVATASPEAVRTWAPATITVGSVSTNATAEESARVGHANVRQVRPFATVAASTSRPAILIVVCVERLALQEHCVLPELVYRARLDRVSVVESVWTLH